MLCFCITNTVNAQQLPESGFEIVETSWKKTNSSVLFSLSTDESKEGSQSARIENTSTSSYGIEQIITDIQPETTYAISAYVKTPIPPPSKAFIRIAWYENSDASGSQIRTDNSEVLSAESDWTEQNITATSPANTHSAKIRLLVAEGTAYFDTISMQIIQYTITPTQPTPKPTEMDSVPVTNIYLSEVMVAPESGEPEWVELYNDNSHTVTITNWYIDDIADGGGSPKSVTITIPGKQYASFELSSALFNNSGDEIRLLNTDQVEIDHVSYSNSLKGYSIGKNDAGEFCQQEPSQNKSNNPCLEDTEEEIVVPTLTPTAIITPSILGTSTNKILSPTPVLTQTAKHLPIITLRPTTVEEDNESAVHIVEPVSSNQTDAKPWLLLSGSYSTLALISVVSKILFIRYT